MGMAYGPLAYARSRYRARHRRRAGAPQAHPGGHQARRILIVSDEYKPVIGGAARNIELLAHQLCERGHSVAVATAWQPAAPAVEDDGAVRVHRIRDLSSRVRRLSDDPNRHHAPPFPDPEAISALRRLIARVEPDLVHAYGWLTASAAAALGGSEIPLLVSTHDYGNVCPIFTLVREGEACSGPGLTKCLSCASSTYGRAKASVAVTSLLVVRPLLRRKVRAIHSVSRFTAEVNGNTLRIPGVEPVVIPNFLDREAVEEVDHEIVEGLPEEPFILFVGHLRPYKGVHVLLAAYELLDQPPPLVMVGTTASDSPSSFPLGVTTFTYVPHGTVMEMWRRSLFGVSPSIAPEALPSVVLEAMSEGKAMIGSRIGGYGDMIEEDETGLLVEPGSSRELAQAMALLAGDRELRERLGEAAALRARVFSPESVMPRMESLYQETIRASGAR
jgi:glycosyltransferase involved in cell wall biosynthesis